MGLSGSGNNEENHIVNGSWIAWLIDYSIRAILSVPFCPYHFVLEPLEKWLFSPIFRWKPWGVGSSMGIFGERFTGSKHPNNFFTNQKLIFIKQYNTMSCHEANQNPLRKPKPLYFLWLSPWFNSNVNAIISLRTYFANLHFVKPRPVRINNPTSAYSVIIFIILT